MLTYSPSCTKEPDYFYSDSTLWPFAFKLYPSHLKRVAGYRYSDSLLAVCLAIDLFHRYRSHKTALPKHTGRDLILAATDNSLHNNHKLPSSTFSTLSIQITMAEVTAESLPCPNHHIHQYKFPELKLSDSKGSNEQPYFRALVFFYKKPGLTDSFFHEHWKSIHADLTMQTRDAGVLLVRYSQVSSLNPQLVL